MNAGHRNNRPAKKFATPSTAAKARRPLPLQLARALALGSLVSCALALALSLVGAAVASANADPESLLFPLSIAITATAALAGGFVTRRAARLSPLVCGLLHGAVLLLITLALACLGESENASASETVRWGLRGGMLAFSFLGALLGANLPKSKKRKRRT